MGPPESPEQNSVVERFNRTLGERLRTQLLHGNLPPRLWGEVALATSYTLNLCPSKSISGPCPDHSWQKLALRIKSPKVPYRRLRAIGCLAYTIPPGHCSKLQPRSLRTVLVGYEKNSNAYWLWDPNSNRVIVSNDVVFNEKHFPLRDNVHNDPSDLSIQHNEVWDEIWEIPGKPHRTPSASQPNPPTPSSDTPTQTRPARQQIPTTRLGNLVAYHTMSEAVTAAVSSVDDGADHDSPTYSSAMKGQHRDEWLQAMNREFSSLQAHGVGTLVEPPRGANILPGMWRLKRKRDEFGRVTTYKA